MGISTPIRSYAIASTPGTNGLFDNFEHEVLDRRLADQQQLTAEMYREPPGWWDGWQWGPRGWRGPAWW